MASTTMLLSFFLLATSALATKAPLQMSKPYNIGHRGNCGVYVEETVAAYKSAIRNGADFIECDVVAVKGGELVCFHDAFLDDMTDVASKPEFASRKATRYFEGANYTAFWITDFTLAELHTLCLKQRFPAERPTFWDCKFQIPTFEEYIKIALEADRVVGIYPEIKSPVFTNKWVKFPGGIDFETALVNTLKKYGYKGKYGSSSWKKQPLFIQSFAPTSLIKASKMIDSPLVFLVDDFVTLTQDTQEDWWKITRDSYLKDLQKKCNGRLSGLGPWKDNILVPSSAPVPNTRFPEMIQVTFPQSGNKTLKNPNDLVVRAHKLGLQVHPYTFRNENRRLKSEYQGDYWNEYIRWNKEPLHVDGFFTDFPGSFHKLQLYYPLKQGPRQ